MSWLSLNLKPFSFIVVVLRLMSDYTLVLSRLHFS